MPRWKRWIDAKPLPQLVGAALGTACAGSLLLCCVDYWTYGYALSCIVLGASLLSWLHYHACRFSLQRGLAGDRWTEQEQQKPAARVRIAMSALAPLWLLLLIFSITTRVRYGRHLNGLTWFPLYLLLGSFTTLSKLLSPLKPRSEPGSWRETMQPIRSEHWGKLTG